jgi:rod shape-determining protein MreC
MKSSATRNTILFAVIVILVFLSFNFYRSEIKSFFYLISSPAQKIFWQGGKNISNFFNFWADVRFSQKKIEILEEKNIQLLTENEQLKSLKDENDVLRSALDLQLQKQFELVLGQTIFRDSAKDFITIDKGSNDGIAVDMPVITSKNILCGKVFEVYENFSRIMLVSSSLSSFDAKISDSDIYGVVKGKNGFNMEITLIPREQDISVGNLVTTSPLEGIFPRGLLIGEIKDINKKDTEPFQSANIRPLFEAQDLNMVFVILRAK